MFPPRYVIFDDCALAFPGVLLLSAYECHTLPSPCACVTEIIPQETYDDRELEKALKSFAGVGSEPYRRMVEPGCRLSKQIGNTYTASVFANIVCLVDAHGSSLEGETALVFSYGSG